MRSSSPSDWAKAELKRAADLQRKPIAVNDAPGSGSGSVCLSAVPPLRGIVQIATRILTQRRRQRNLHCRSSKKCKGVTGSYAYSAVERVSGQDCRNAAHSHCQAVCSAAATAAPSAGVEIEGVGSGPIIIL